MSDRSQRIFDATPARKQKAKLDGNVPRSAEAGSTVAFAAATLATFACLPHIGDAAATSIRAFAAHPDAGNDAWMLARVPAIACVPIGAAALGGIGASFAQSGGLALKLPSVDLKRLDPVAGFKRMIGLDTIVALLRALVAFAVVTLALWPVIGGALAAATALSGEAAFGALVGDAARRAFWTAIGVGALFACADYALVRRTWLRNLKMTLDEVRRDHKDSDGDPQTRARRKQLHRSLVAGSIARTKDASFVVVNPTHIAIAVRYAPPEVPVPEILVRAADDAALAVKTIAREKRIPIVENIALARELFAHGEAGRAIPVETFLAVARIIAELTRAGAFA